MNNVQLIAAVNDNFQPQQLVWNSPYGSVIAKTMSLVKIENDIEFYNVETIDGIYCVPHTELTA